MEQGKDCKDTSNLEELVDNQSEKECLFCRFVQTKENLVYEDTVLYMFKDIAPKAEHHLLLIPK